MRALTAAAHRLGRLLATGVAVTATLAILAGLLATPAAAAEDDTPATPESAVTLTVGDTEVTVTDATDLAEVQAAIQAALTSDTPCHECPSDRWLIVPTATGYTAWYTLSLETQEEVGEGLNIATLTASIGAALPHGPLPALTAAVTAGVTKAKIDDCHNDQQRFQIRSDVIRDPINGDQPGALLWYCANNMP